MATVALVHAILTAPAALICIAFVGCVVAARPLYRLRWRSPAAGTYGPTVAVFVPCKGVEPDTRENVGRVLALEGASRRLFFVVEREDDPAHALIAEEIAGRHDARIVVAGHSEACTQKLHNLVRGLEAAGGADDVYVFLDSDLGVDAGFLGRLVAPLADSRVAATTGCTWLVPMRGTLGERIHAFWFAFVRMLLCCPAFNGVAGCCTAIRRRDFDSLRVAAAWSRSLSDDVALTRMLVMARRRALFVPACVGTTRGGIQTVAGVLTWMTRQAQMVKYELRPLWLLAAAYFGWLSLHLVALPFFAVASALVPAALPLFAQVGSFCLLVMASATALRWGVRDGQRSLVWFLLSPLFILAAYAGLVGSAFSSTVRWGGASYRMGFDGSVREIDRS